MNPQVLNNKLAFALTKTSALRVLSIALISITCAQCLYWRWPISVSFDVTFSLFAAQNRIEHGEYKTIEPNNAFDGDLASIKTQWLNTWPPFVTLIYSALLASGVTPGQSTSFIVFFLVILGTLGWVLWAKNIGATDTCQLFLAATIPWMGFPIFAFTCLYNDHFIWAFAPWAYISITKIPDTNYTVFSRDWFWVKTLAAGLLTGLLVTIKYSAFPLLLGAGVYFIIRDGYFVNLRKFVHTVWYAIWLVLPGLIVYAINRLCTGQATAVTRKGIHYTPIGLAQIWNLMGPPLIDIFGISQALSNVNKIIPIPLWVSISIACIFIFNICCLLFLLRKGGNDLAAIRHLIGMTFAMWGFLLVCTLAFGYYFDWTSETRYYIPVYFGWYIVLTLAVFDKAINLRFRVLLAICCLATILATMMSGAAKPLVKVPPKELLNSRLAAPSDEFKAYEFIADKIARSGESAKPRLIIAESSLIMNETIIPTVPWMYLEKKTRLYSSKPLVTWSYLKRDESAKIFSKIGGAAQITRVDVPGNPQGELLIIQFL